MKRLFSYALLFSFLFFPESINFVSGHDVTESIRIFFQYSFKIAQLTALYHAVKQFMLVSRILSDGVHYRHAFAQLFKDFRGNLLAMIGDDFGFQCGFAAF